MIEQYNIVSPFQAISNTAQVIKNNEHLAKFLYDKICSRNETVEQILIVPDAKQRGYVIVINREI